MEGIGIWLHSFRFTTYLCGFVPQKSGFDQNYIVGAGADTYFCTALVKTNQSL